MKKKDIKKFYDIKKMPDGGKAYIMKTKPWEALIEAQLNNYNLTVKK